MYKLKVFIFDLEKGEDKEIVLMLNTLKEAKDRIREMEEEESEELKYEMLDLSTNEVVLANTDSTNDGIFDMMFPNSGDDRE